MRKLVGFVVGLFVCASASADIFQWFDGDGDSSLFLSTSNAEPFANLSGQTLWWADLVGADLVQANMFQTNLHFADLFAANLFASVLTLSDLSFADLSFATVSNAQMQGADLSNAIFFGANLFGANLSFSNVDGADFSFANLHFADVTSVDMSGLIGWETSTWSESFYDINTLFPDGMDPVVEGMTFIPAPGAFALLCVAGLRIRRRR